MDGGAEGGRGGGAAGALALQGVVCSARLLSCGCVRPVPSRPGPCLQEAPSE